MDRMHDLAGYPDAVGFACERVEGRGHTALERVLDRNHGPVHDPVLDGHHRLVDRCTRHLLDTVRRRSAERLLAVSAGWAEKTDAHQAPLGTPAIAVSTASISSGESSTSEVPSCRCFTYTRA